MVSGLAEAHHAPKLRRREAPIDHDGVVVLHNVNWWQYETLLAVRGDATGARISYLNGILELM
ncbi:MAG: Uma2 family endonuclease, partial [Clostridia bacterium]|nr:Uma2 family endonuclease [Deltaproteobacteria bacterium]